MDAYVLVSDADDRVIARLLRLAGTKRGVRFAAALTGAHDAIVAVQAADLVDLDRLVRREVRLAGVGGTETLVSFPRPWPQPGSKAPRLVEAFVQMRVRPGKADAAGRALSRMHGVQGVAAVAGRFDLLIEIGGNSFDELTDTVMGGLQKLTELQSTETSFAVFPDAKHVERPARTRAPARRRRLAASR